MTKENLKPVVPSRDLLEVLIPGGIIYRTEKALSASKKSLTYHNLNNLFARGFVRTNSLVIDAFTTHLGFDYILTSDYIFHDVFTIPNGVITGVIYGGLRGMAHMLARRIQEKSELEIEVENQENE